MESLEEVIESIIEGIGVTSPIIKAKLKTELTIGNQLGVPPVAMIQDNYLNPTLRGMIWREAVEEAGLELPVNREKATVACESLWKGVDIGLTSVMKIVQEKIGSIYQKDLIVPLLRTIGKNIKVGKGSWTIGKEAKDISIKGIGKETGLSKSRAWGTVAEALKNEVAYEVLYFTAYKTLLYYFTHPVASEKSCMRGEFKELPYHPCLVYAHDAALYTNQQATVSDDIRLAVLFKDGEPLARCMVSKAARGKAYGKGASTLVKLLGLPSIGIRGSINIIKVGYDFLMPYIDGHSTVTLQGKIGGTAEGVVSCSGTAGIANNLVYCELEDVHVEEGEALHSYYHDCYITRGESVNTFPNEELVYIHHEDVAFSSHYGRYITTTDDEWNEFRGEYYLTNDLEEILITYIKDEVCPLELLEVLNGRD